MRDGRSPCTLPLVACCARCLHAAIVSHQHQSVPEALKWQLYCNYVLSIILAGAGTTSTREASLPCSLPLKTLEACTCSQSVTGCSLPVRLLESQSCASDTTPQLPLITSGGASPDLAWLRHTCVALNCCGRTVKGRWFGLGVHSVGADATVWLSV